MRMPVNIDVLVSGRWYRVRVDDDGALERVSVKERGLHKTGGWRPFYIYAKATQPPSDHVKRIYRLAMEETK